MKLLSGSVAATTVLGGVIVAAPSAFATTVPSNVHRIAGSSRLATAIGASQDQFPTTGSATAVVLTRADTYPDALSGGPLAAKVGGPLLLTATGSLDPAVKAEIVRVLPPHRGQGVGQAMLDRGLAQAEETGFSTVETIVWAANDAGLRFALAHGFVETERYLHPGDSHPFITLRLT